MRSILSAVLAFVVATALLFTTQGGVADAAFHCMRIHTVAAGYNGNNNIQYVELRLDMAGHRFVAGHKIEFFSSTGQLKATFTFPSDVTNGSLGDSILIATAEFNLNVLGGTSDFTFTGANTVGANGGDPLHPVQLPGGSVSFAGPPTPTTVCFSAAPPPVDHVAYGGAAAVYGSPATALPGLGTMQSLRLSNLNNPPTNNSTEYALQTVSATTFAVAPANLATNFTSPRNNGRTVLQLTFVPSSVGGVAEAPLFASEGAAITESSGGSDNRLMVLGGVLATAALASGAGWFVHRRRTA